MSPGNAQSVLSRVSWSLEGNDPFIVLEDADIDLAAANAAFTRSANAGQVCIAPKRFLVHKDVVEEFTSKVIATLNMFRVGYDPDISPTIDASWKARYSIRWQTRYAARLSIPEQPTQS
jgi:succinate-semialdehyde dehydrogenase/glutarate-semialdehyde dehydrogenase